MRVAGSTARSGIATCALLGALGACGGAPPSDLLGPAGGDGLDAAAEDASQNQDIGRDSGEARETSRMEVGSGQNSSEDASKGEDGGMSRNDAGACGPPKCAGCCDANGTCAGGTSDNACGTSGATCTDCAMMGQLCTSGACSAAPSCAQSCMGCCQGSMCMTGTGTMACGTGGKPCQTCRAFCLGGICL
jgi:hypothetical protein